ncbi:MAG TPA: von Willebrand factor type A domain-containing protein, partial [Catalimonadaceae bacterium]|nr:von Willebrand factor type A domain-containing protein [Catalimonadaceae bacterium]
MKKFIMSLVLLCSIIAGLPCLGQEKLFTLKLNIQNKETKEAVAFANVRVLGDSNRLVRNAISDINGKIKFKLKAGKYDFVANSAGFKKYRLQKVSIPKTKEITIDLVEEATTMKAVEIKAFKEPLIGISSGECQRLSSEQITKIPTRNPSDMVATFFSGRRKRKEKSVPAIQVVESKAYQANVSGEGYKKMSENPFLKTSRNPLSTFSIDVDRASYTNIRRFLNSGSLPPPEAIRLEEMVNYFTYNFSTPEGNEPFAVKMEYTQCPWNKKHDLVHIGIQGKKVRKEKMPPNNLVFLVDVSGSMDEPNKLPLVKSCLHMLVNQMRPEDKIALVVYAGAAGLVLSSTSGDNKNKIS